MKTLDQRFQMTSRLLTLAAIAGLCLAGLDAMAATLTSPNSAPAAPAKTAAAPVPPPAQAQSLATEDIRDIRPPYHLPPSWLWLAWAGGGLAILALGYGAWRWRHRLGVRVKLPYEIALEQLEAARKLLQPEHAREFSIAVSEVVRDYIEKSFRVRAAHRTSAEFLRDLATRSDSPLIAHQPVLADFLGHCDLAKFARWVLSVPQMEAMLQSARTFIVVTGKPVAETLPVHSVGAKSPPPFRGASTGASASPSKLGVARSRAANLNPRTL